MSASSDKERYQSLFRETDKDGNGSLSIEELVALIMSNSSDQTEDQVRRYFKSSDTSGNGSLSEAEFLSAMGVTPPEKADVMRNAFNEFDVDGNGFINKEDLKKVFAEVGKQFTECQLDRMMKTMDMSGDGKVDYEEYIKRFFKN